MKAKKYLMAFAAIAAMSSCSQEEEFINRKTPSSPDENAVTFSTYLGQALQTRATSIDTEELKNVGFGVFAYHTGIANFDDVDSIPNFMYNQEVTWVAEAPGDTEDKPGAWTYEPKKYWPNEDDHKISFFAYAPHQTTEEIDKGTNITSIPENTDKGVPMIGFRLNPDYKKQIDLLYNARENINLPKPSIDTKVQFEFRHALSRVGFKAIIIVDEVASKDDGSESGDGSNHKDILLDENSTVTINSITFKLSNFSKSGKLNLKTGKWEDITKSGDAMKFKFGKDDFIPGSNILKLGTNENTVADKNRTDESAGKENSRVVKLTDEYLMLIPNLVNDDETIERANVELTVDYTIETEDESLANQKITFNENIPASFDFEFKKGEAYDFVIHIGLTSTKLEASVEEWGNTGTGIDANRTVYESNNYLGTFEMIFNSAAGLEVTVNGETYNDKEKSYKAKVMCKDENGKLKYTIPEFNNIEATYGGSSCMFLGWTTEKDQVIVTGGDAPNNLYQKGDQVEIPAEETLDNFKLYAVWGVGGTD